MSCKSASRGLSLLLLVLLSFPAAAWQGAAPRSAPGEFKDVLDYIQLAWPKLTRSMQDCETLLDPKNPAKSILYLPAEVPVSAQVQALAQRCHIEARNLGKRIEKPGTFDVSTIRPQGLLYLEHPYVVPGGFFNEMYGWDSYFIIRGLLRSGQLELAKGMVENFFYEIDHYGAILNANRGYFLTRSQPPFLSSMVFAIYDAEKAQGFDDTAWLSRARPYIERDYRMWTTAPHLAGDTGLSRYFDFGEGPVPEIASNGDPYYRDVLGLLLLDREEDAGYIHRLKEGESPEVGPAFSIRVCEHSSPDAAPVCSDIARSAFTGDYYKGDRSMRESGFDISFRFGPFSGRTHHYAPVGLNSLLYKTEKDLEKIAILLQEPDIAQSWEERAQHRSALITRFLWDAKRGMFFDYDFTKDQRSHYEYATTFYPLWAGLATRRQATALRKQLKTFELKGGIVMSTTESGVQWDYPYGWAPIQLLTVEGLRRYGFSADADRISRRFLQTVAENFRRDGTIREKYNMVTGSSETKVAAGYRQNVIGFGWTNGVFLELLSGLTQKSR
jgi:alpha,alpha-trehalase